MRSTVVKWHVTYFGNPGWHQQLGGGAVADAILDRIIPGSYKLEIQRQVSMRQRLAEEEMKGSKVKVAAD